MNVDPAGRNRPAFVTAITSAVTAFVGSLATWAIAALPDTVPDEVTVSLYGLLVLVAGAVGAGAGALAQYVGKRAPWAFDTHGSAVAYALSLDPDHHRDELDQILQGLGLESVDQARELIGAPPVGA